jgi:pimeloyl-ACP methyl ester carboxylesterase
MVDGVRLHYLDEGPAEGPVVVALSAQWASFAQYDDWAPALTDRYHVLRLDLPGHGLSGRIASGDYSIAAYIRLTIGLLDQLGIARLFLVGTSFSGAAAFRYAAVAGDRLLGLVLANSSGLPRLPGGAAPNAAPPTRWLRWLEPYWRPKAYFRWKLDQLLQDKSRITPQRVREYRDMNNAPGRIAEAAARLKAYRAEDPAPVLAAITAPVLIQWSTHATYLPAVDADRFEAALTQAATRKIIYSGVGHLIIEDAPEATGRDVRLFLDAVMSGRPLA